MALASTNHTGTIKLKYTNDLNGWHSKIRFRVENNGGYCFLTYTTKVHEKTITTVSYTIKRILHYFSKMATPGNDLPSIHSRKAPPAADT